MIQPLLAEKNCASQPMPLACFCTTPPNCKARCHCTVLAQCHRPASARRHQTTRHLTPSCLSLRANDGYQCQAQSFLLSDPTALSPPHSSTEVPALRDLSILLESSALWRDGRTFLARGGTMTNNRPIMLSRPVAENASL